VILFHDKILEAELKEFGIRVPYAKRGEYQGREFVFLGEEGFEQAFCDLYVKDAMDSRAWRLEKHFERLLPDFMKYPG